MKNPSKKYYPCLFFKYSIIIVMLLFLSSCFTPRHTPKVQPGDDTLILYMDIGEKINLLQHDLTALNDEIDFKEARLLAETSIKYSMFLADEYRLVFPPYLHNILVRIGIKDRGLCYHWTEDLMKRLDSLELKSFSLHLGVARKGSIFREHNSVVVTAGVQKFSEGIVLDPWRNGGDLYWASVKSDKYPWEER